jgi:Predicted metal-binding, possibly nucleic acid-binding protein
MRISLRALATAENARIAFDYTIDLSKEEVCFAFPFPEPVRLSGIVQDNAGAVSLEGVIEARVHMRCARCNSPVIYEKWVPVRFLLAKSVQDEDKDDVFIIEGDEVDPAEVLVPELILDMEMAVLCREDCKGLCPKCGHDLNKGDCGCNRVEIDPRWESLRNFVEKNKE